MGIAIAVGLGLVGLVVAGGFAAANYEGNHARVVEAQVALEATRAARQANSMLTAVLVLIIALLLMAFVAYWYFKLRNALGSGGRRAVGRGAHRPYVLASQQPGEIGGGVQRSLEMMLQMQMLQMLDRRGQSAPVQQRALPVDGEWGWGGGGL